jgi:hypothetical protein
VAEFTTIPEKERFSPLLVAEPVPISPA